MTKISGQFLILGQFQDNFKISGISGQLGALHFSPEGELSSTSRRYRHVKLLRWQMTIRLNHGTTTDTHIHTYIHTYIYIFTLATTQDATHSQKL